MKFLVFQHVATETPGSFREVMAARGAVMHAVELDEGAPIPALEGYDALLVMGGPQDVWEEDKYPWLVAEKAAIRDWVTRQQKPYLGICLGNQLLGEVLGGTVGLMHTPEVGIRRIPVAPDPIFAGIGALCTGFEWHGAEIKILPPGVEQIAHSAHCEVQAIRHGRHAYGLQFHMELMPDSATRWAEMPEYAAALERAKGKGCIPAVQAEVNANYTALRRDALAIFGNFMEIAAGK